MMNMPKTIEYVPDQQEDEQDNNDFQKETGTDLVIPKTLTAVDVFGCGKAEDLVEQIKAKVRDFKPDMTTEKGRKEIASLAYKIAQSKTALDKMGKEMTEKQREIIDAVNAERKMIRDDLDKLKAEVRKPLTDWENREKDRVERLQKYLEYLAIQKNFAVFNEDGAPSTSADIEMAMANSANIYKQTEWQEFLEKADEQYHQNMKVLQEAFAERKKQEAEKVELERLRKAEEERQAKEREERLKQEAADKARKEAEEKAEEDRIAAEKKAEREKQDAIEAERRRVEVEKRAEEEAAQKRQADLEHRKKINNEIFEAISGITFADKEIIKEIITAIAKGQIPHTSIKY